MRQIPELLDEKLAQSIDDKKRVEISFKANPTAY